ncbi:MAG: hypothetical protein AAGK21_05655 [Bacteroidota bacterium]
MRSFLALAFALVLSGCFQFNSLLTVRTDGSATLRDEVSLTGLAALAMEEDGGEFADRSAAEERGRQLGPNVELVSYEPTTSGYVAVYEVPDLSAFRLSTSVLQMEDSPSPIGDEVSVQLAFEPASGSTPAALSIHMPKPPPEKPQPPAPAGEPEVADFDTSGIEMMRSFFQDASMNLSIEVDGEIVRTDAPHVEGSTVTVLDFPMVEFIDFMAENPDLASSSEPPPPAQMYDILDSIEGIRFMRPGTVRVQFQ